jgi:hypothetical protein
MHRRDLLLGLGGLGVGGVAITRYTDVELLGTGTGDDMADDGGVLGFRYLDGLDWDRTGTVTATFAEDHGSDFFTISHASFADDDDQFIFAEDTPDFGGEVRIDFSGRVAADGREFPSREFAFDFYRGELLSVAATVEEHLGTDRFTVPKKVSLPRNG